jgi:uncharacterized protein (DUF1330 family)
LFSLLPLIGGTRDKPSDDCLSILAGFAAGALTVQGLHAQAKPPAYTISEIDVTNVDGFTKEFAPIAGKALQHAGAKFLARGGKTVSIDGEPTKSRVVVHAWESIDKAQAGFAPLHRAFLLDSPLLWPFRHAEPCGLC